MNSPYALVGAKLCDNGYHAIPVMPNTKRPGAMVFGQWYSKFDWTEYCDRAPTHIEIALWEKWKDSGVCVALDHQLKVVDIDTDDPTIMEAALSVLPDSNVKKRGKKGFSAFYRGSKAIVSTPFDLHISGVRTRVVDLLAHGRQTILPPSIHPDTGQPYIWTTEDNLVDTDIEKLPLLPDDIAEKLAEVLAPFGYAPTPEHRAIASGKGEGYWREINDLAMSRFRDWVPALKLCGNEPTRDGYRCSADWRGGDGLNVSFHPNGIKDFVTDERFTPISLVMKAFSCDLFTATDWLKEQLGYKPEGVDDGFDIAGFVARSRKSVAPEKKLVAPVQTAIVETVEPEDKATPKIAAPRGKINPFDTANADGILGAISEWILSTARRPVPEFAMIGAVVFLSAIYGRRFTGPTGLAPNIYMIGIGGPGYGKDHALKCIPLLAHDCGYQMLVGPGDVTSGSAIERVVRRQPSFFMPWDEFGVILQGMTGQHSQSWTKSIRKTLLELYSRSTSMWTGKEHSDPKRASASAEPIFWPNVSILGMSTPTEFYAGITDSNMSDGLMARLTVIFAKARPEKQKTKSVNLPPLSLVDAIKSHVENLAKKTKLAASSWRDGKKPPVFYEIPWENKEAEDYLDQIENWQLDTIDDDPSLEGTVGRAGEQSVKLAMIRAISRNPAAPAVSVEDMEWGWAFVQRSLDSIDEGVRLFMAGSDFERLHKTILEHISTSGPEGIRKSDLLRKRLVRSAKPFEFDAAIKWLMDANLVTSKITISEKGGRPGARYLTCQVLDTA